MSNRYSATLLLTLPFLVAMVPAFATPVRTIEIAVSHSGMSPGHIEVPAGERVRLNVTSTDGAHACRLEGFRLNGGIPAGGGTVTFELLPRDPGVFEIECADDRGRSVGARLVVAGNR
ncbi:MAG TPA: cupredoxin domain-containing protein [Vicinamibacterales bacterium]|nr:cupredoxin domain-containing protein [Vicinamibacterales bacterium]